MELRLSCTNPSICETVFIMVMSHFFNNLLFNKAMHDWCCVRNLDVGVTLATIIYIHIEWYIIYIYSKVLMNWYEKKIPIHHPSFHSDAESFSREQYHHE